MKKVILLIVALFFVNTVLAGDAGYFSETCHSKSKRTVLTTLENRAGGFYSIRTLIVDGVPKVYDSREDNIRVENNGDYNLSVYKDDVLVLDIYGSKITVLEDPRKGSDIEYGMSTKGKWSTNLICETYQPLP